MDEPAIQHILDEWEREAFLGPTMIASGHRTVAAVLAGMPDIKSLVDNRSSAMPVVLARYRRTEAGLPDSTRLVYFVVFGLASLREAARDITDYLRRSKSRPLAGLMSPWHPFLHGVQTLEAFTGGQVPAPKSNAAMREFERFLEAFAKWERLHQAGGGAPAQPKPPDRK